MNEVIITEILTKRYKDVLAVSGISLNVRKAEIYGFLGLNGAGKTTTIRMLLGMINPDNGTAFINGKKVHPNNTELWKDIGSLVVSTPPIPSYRSKFLSINCGSRYLTSEFLVSLMFWMT